MPGVLLTQLLSYREAWEDGLSRGVEAGAVVAATGHSGGIIAAARSGVPALVGLEDDDALLGYFHLAVQLGHLVSAASESVGNAELDAAMRGDERARTPMAAVAGLRLDRLSALLDEHAALDGGDDSDDPDDRVRIASSTDRRVRCCPARQTRWNGAVADSPRRSRPTPPTAACSGNHSRSPRPATTRCSARSRTVIARCAAVGVRCAPPTAGIALVSPAGPAVLGDGTSSTDSQVDITPDLVHTMLTRPGRWSSTATALATGSLGLRPADWLIDLGVFERRGAVGPLRRARGPRPVRLALTDESDRRALVTVGAVPAEAQVAYEQFAPNVVTLDDGVSRSRTASPGRRVDRRWSCPA